MSVQVMKKRVVRAEAEKDAAKAEITDRCRLIYKPETEIEEEKEKWK